MWGKPDRIIAETLLAEGFTTTRAKTPRTSAEKRAAGALQIETMRRNVWNDREWWRVFWKKRAAEPVTNEDASVQREEHIASLESDLEEIHDLIDEAGTKPTAKAMLIGEKRQTRALLAKARGVDELAPRDSDPDGAKPAVIGLVFGTKNISPEMRAKLREQGVEVDEEA